MSSTRILTILFSVALMSATALYLAYGQAGSSGRPEPQTCLLQETPQGASLTTYYEEPVDQLADCQQFCRSIWGVDPYGLGGGRGGDIGRGVGYAVCIQKCNIDFWKARDRQIERLEKEMK